MNSIGENMKIKLNNKNLIIEGEFCCHKKFIIEQRKHLGVEMVEEILMQMEQNSSLFFKSIETFSYGLNHFAVLNVIDFVNGNLEVIG
jgi:hypothetical protein